MSRDVGTALRVVGGGLIAAGVLAAGAAIGAATERVVFSRTSRHGEDWPTNSYDSTEREVIVTDGTALHVEIDECDSPLTVIFCHGYALSLESWCLQRRDLQDQARLVFYDQRSHGLSGRADFDSHHVDQLGEDLFDIIAEVAPTGPLVLIGHSMGGMTIMALAQGHPALIEERVYGVALIASSAGGLARMTFGLPGPIGQVLATVASPVAASLARRRAFVERSRRTGSDLSTLLTRIYAFGSVASTQAGQLVSDMIAATPIDVLAEFIPALQDHDKRAALPTLQHAEVLVIVGDSDRLTPRSHSEEIVRLIPGAEYVVISRAGHMVNMEHPDEVDAHLLALINKVKRNAQLEPGGVLA